VVPAAIGVVAGGLLSSISWHWIFLSNIPIGAAVLLLGVHILPTGGGQASGGIDVLGAVSGTGGLTLLILGVVQGGHQGWTSPSTLGMFAASSVLLAIFLARQRPRQTHGPHNTAATTRGAIRKRRHDHRGHLDVRHLPHHHPLHATRPRTRTTSGRIPLPADPDRTYHRHPARPRLAMRIGRHNGLTAGLAIQTIGLTWWAAAIDPDASVLTPTVLWSLGAGASILSTFILCTTTVTGPLAGSRRPRRPRRHRRARTSTLTTTGHLSSLTSGYAVALGVAATLALFGACYSSNSEAVESRTSRPASPRGLPRVLVAVVPRQPGLAGVAIARRARRQSRPTSWSG
jgi:hypothetical protein